MKKDMIFVLITLLAVHSLTGCVRPRSGGGSDSRKSLVIEKAPAVSLNEGNRWVPPYQQTSDAFYSSLDAILGLSKTPVQVSGDDAKPKGPVPGAAEKVSLDSSLEEKPHLPPYQQTSEAFYISLNSIVHLATMSVRETVAEEEPVPRPSDSEDQDQKIAGKPLQTLSPPPPLITRKAPPKPSGPANWKTEYYGSRPEALFEAAFYLYHEMDYEKAREAFGAFLDQFPNHRLTDQAQYWIGECFYAQRLYREAGDAYRQVLTRFNTGNKFADAFFKTGLCYHRLNAHRRSKEYWNRLIQRFPHSRAAEMALRMMGNPAA
jgi:tol-pal system protein YbgF